MRIALASATLVLAVVSPACSQRTGALPVAQQVSATRASSAAVHTVLHRFTGRYASSAGASDGANPYAGLIAVRGTLYGTTQTGGANSYGTVFSLSATGAEHVLYSFGSTSNDGIGPQGGLLAFGGTLYGTTWSGAQGAVVYAVSAAGNERVLHRFRGGRDGAQAKGSLVAVNGLLYGTTASGGAHGAGTAYSISTAGAERVLHDFGGAKDGSAPYAGLIEVKGLLYGTTYSNRGGDAGTLFSLSTAGAERVLGTFGFYGGVNPSASLIDVGGRLYGTTLYGGNVSDGGTVFSVTTSGTNYRTLHSFAGGKDGSNSYASLIDVDGTLYGTTYGGGGSTACTLGCGTVFSISTSGTERVLYAFKGGADGDGPVGGLAYLNGVFYGTTQYGGVMSCDPPYGCGTVFALKP